MSDHRENTIWLLLQMNVHTVATAWYRPMSSVIQSRKEYTVTDWTLWIEGVGVGVTRGKQRTLRDGPPENLAETIHLAPEVF